MDRGFLPGGFHGQEPTGYSAWGSREPDTTEGTQQAAGGVPWGAQFPDQGAPPSVHPPGSGAGALGRPPGETHPETRSRGPPSARVGQGLGSRGIRKVGSS